MALENLDACLEESTKGRLVVYALMDSDTPIQPLLIGGDAEALALSRALAGRDILVTAIRPPTVPEGQARLRVTLSAAHEEDDVDRLLDALETAKCQN